MAPISTPIPFELIDAIIDELHDNSRVLKNCSLVGRAFTARSQTHLFHRVKLSYPLNCLESTALVKELVGLLTPNFARLIRHLRVENYAETSRIQLDNDNDNDNDTLLPLVLSRLRKLQSFTLSLNNSPSRGMVFRLSNTLMAALVTMFNSTRVAEVNLHFIQDFPAGMLAYHCTDIRKVNFNGCFGASVAFQYFSGRGSREVPDLSELCTTEEAGRLEVVVVNPRSVQCLRVLFEATLRPDSQLTFTHVQEIVVNGISSSALDFAAKIAAAAGKSLQRFTWDMNESDIERANLFHAYGIELLPLPRSIRLAFEHSFHESALHLRWLGTALQNNPTHSTVEDILLVFTAHRMKPGLKAHSVWNTYASELATLDSLLASTKYARLQRVAIFMEHIAPNNIIYPSYVPNQKDLSLGCVPVSYYAGVVEGLRKELPLLDAKGVLSVQWMMTEKRQLGLGVALRALEEGIEGGVHVGRDGRFKIGREYHENALGLLLL